MILEEATKEAFNYYSTELTPHSSKPILAACDICGKIRETTKNVYRTLCMQCAKKGENKGKKSPFFGKTHSEETKALMSTSHKGIKFTDKHKAKISAANKGNTNTLGHKLTEDHKAKLSKAHSGDNHYNWRRGISFEPYCIKFNKEYKEHIRDLFGNECFLCGLSEADNGRKLSVHHKDYNKDCGCDETKCICVPLCISCHIKTNNDRDYWQCLIMEMLKPIEAWD